MDSDLLNTACFGVAGNFTGHLEQAGEDKDFRQIKTKSENAPKAVFPTYIPRQGDGIPSFLTVYPFSSSSIIYPPNEDKLQIEPECAIVCRASWQGDRIVSLEPYAFAASNDCSIRKDGASKISQKKNWGKCSKGFSATRISIDTFAPGGILDRYRIASYMLRDGTLHQYGEDSAVRNYSYIYGELLQWALEKLNTQTDQGPVESVNTYLVQAGHPQEIMISIGATRYTDFGKTNFLSTGDQAIVVLYPQDRYTAADMENIIKGTASVPADISLLRQTVQADS